MPFGTEVGLGSGDIVLDGEPAPTEKAQQASSPRGVNKARGVKAKVSKPRPETCKTKATDPRSRMCK